MKIFIISKNIWLETVLKQHFSSLKIVTGDQEPIEADIIINDDVNLNIKSLDKTWLLVKPFSIKKIIDIIEQAIKLLSNNVIIIGLIRFYPRENLCKLGEEEIPLTQKETEILLYLSTQTEEVDKLTLLHEVWGYTSEISTHTLETHIYKLRNKFSSKCEIITSSEKGYALFH